MSREIKFRAWDKEEKQMHQIQKMSFKTGKMLPYGWNIEYDGSNFELMQYTGLKDKNGVEIYEGDIVLKGEYIERIEYYDGRFRVTNYDGGSDDLAQFVIRNKIEVIGNIYENPGLLEA